MFVTLIPLFLLANVSVHESDWKYGPEVIYDVQVDSMSQSYQIKPQVPNLSWMTKLKCREKSRLILSCYIYPLELHTDQHKESNYSTEVPFELHFGNRGVEKIVCSSLLQPALIDTVRTVADQFNLGADLSKTSGDIFNIMENSTTGECMTRYLLSSSHGNPEDVDSGSSSSSSESEEEDDNNCEIVIMPETKTPSSEMRAINKNRRLNECRHQYRHVFAIMQDASPDFIGSPIDTPVKTLIENKFVSNSMQFNSSESQMTIRNNSFMSYTEKVFITSNSTSPAPIKVTEVVTVKLEKIVAAKAPLSSIQHPTNVSIFPERWLHSGDNKFRVEDRMTK